MNIKKEHFAINQKLKQKTTITDKCRNKLKKEKKKQ